MKTIKLLLVWLWVVIPLGWGVLKSAQKSVPLFRATATAPAPVSPAK